MTVLLQISAEYAWQPTENKMSVFSIGQCCDKNWEL